MPTGFLSDSDRARLSGFPPEIPTEDLFSYFTLTGADRALVPTTSAPTNRIGFALSLCAVRYLGFCPEDLSTAPESVLWYVSEQLGVPSEALEGYGGRAQTRADHLRTIYEHLGFRKAAEEDLQELTSWLADRALEHDDPAFLVWLATEKLRKERMARPSLWRLERMVARGRDRAMESTFRAIAPLLTEERKARLDSLLIPDTASRPTTLTWLKQEATSNTPRAILGQLKKLAHLRRMGAEGWDLSSMNPNRLKHLAKLGRKYTAQPLRRQAPERRYPVLVAFLHDSYAEITDEVVDLFERCLSQADTRARRQLEEFRKGAARATNEKVRLFGELGSILLDPAIPDGEVRAAIYEHVTSPDRLRSAVEESEKLMRPLDDNYFDFLAERYSYLRQFAPAFLEAFEFRSNLREYPLLVAVELLKKLNAEGRRRIPDGAPLGFVPQKWRPYVIGEEDGHVDRRYWELCVLVVLREALRSGDVWVEGSRRYADPQSYLIPKDRCCALRSSLPGGVSGNGSSSLRTRPLSCHTSCAPRASPASSSRPSMRSSTSDQLATASRPAPGTRAARQRGGSAVSSAGSSPAARHRPASCRHSSSSLSSGATKRTVPTSSSGRRRR